MPTSETHRQLSGSARTVEDVSVRRQQTEDIIERRGELGWRQLCIRDEPFVHIGEQVIVRHNHDLRHAAASQWDVSPSAERAGHHALSKDEPFAPARGYCALTNPLADSRWAGGSRPSNPELRHS
jgi:hypothetical protein